jgi:polar amino acid transport system substrate-binding protein
MVQRIKAVIVLKDKIMHCSLSITFFFAGISLANASYADTLKVCYDQWAPMTIFPSEESAERGVVIDMLDEIYTSQDYELEYFEVPLARGLNMVANGLCDMLPEYIVSKSAEKDFVYANEKTFAYTTAFIVRRDDPWRYDGIESLKGKHVATGPGWDYSAASIDYQNYIDDPKNASLVDVIAGYDDVVERIFHMISEKRIDLYADNDLVLQHVLNQTNLHDTLKVVRPGLDRKLIEIPIFSKMIPTAKRQELIRIWDEGRLSMKGEKEKKLFEKYQVGFAE